MNRYRINICCYNKIKANSELVHSFVEAIIVDSIDEAVKHAQRLGEGALADSLIGASTVVAQVCDRWNKILNAHILCEGKAWKKVR